MFSTAPPRRSAGVPWLEPGHRSGRRHHRRRRRHPAAYLVPLLLLAIVGGAITLYVRHERKLDRQRAEAARYVKAWTARDARAMYDALDATSRQTYTFDRFRALQRRADSAATVRTVRIGRPSDPKDGAVTVPVAVTTRYFGTLRARMRLPVD